MSLFDVIQDGLIAALEMDGYPPEFTIYLSPDQMAAVIKEGLMVMNKRLPATTKRFYLRVEGHLIEVRSDDYAEHAPEHKGLDTLH